MIRNLFGGSKCRTIDVCDIFGDGSGKALYRLDGNANDESGNYHGTETAITYGGGVYERGAVFNNSRASSTPTSYITTPVLSLANFAISFYYKKAVTGTHGIAGKFVSTWTHAIIAYSDNIGIGIGGTVYNSSTYTDDLDFHHYTISRNGSTISFYKDGSFLSSVSAVSTTMEINVFGCYVNALSTTHANGSLDQVRIFNRAITATEVATLYAECEPTSTVSTDKSLLINDAIAHYKLDGNALDSMGNYNGTATNVTYVDSNFGQAGVFNGTSSVIALPSNVDDSLRTASSFTVSAWVNPSSYASDSSTIMFLLDDIYLRLHLDATGKLEFLVNNSSLVESKITDTVAIGTNSWTHVLATGDSSGIRLYKNNVQVGTTVAWNGTFYTYTDTAYKSNRIGASLISGATRFEFNGSIDQVRIYNRALTQSEVTELYNEASPTSLVTNTNPFNDSSLKAMYRFENNANDELGVYNGTATNVTYSAGRFGDCAVFNGSSSKVDTNIASTSLTQFSTSVWFKANASTVGTIYQKSKTGLTYAFGGTAGVLQFEYFTSNWFSFNISNSCVLGTWYNVIITYDGTVIRAYLNGSLANSVTATHDATVVDIFIGSYQGTSSYFNGSIDQVRIFNKALTASEVQALASESSYPKVTLPTVELDPFLDNSCKALYKFNGNVLDSYGVYNGTATNVTYGTGKFGQCAVFNGSSSYVANVSFPQLGTTNAISLWFKATAFSAAAGVATWSNGTNRVDAWVNTNQIQVKYNATWYSVTVTMSTAVWYHLAVCIVNGIPLVYLDGRNLTLTSSGGTAYAFTQGIEIGRATTASSYYFNGSIDQLRIFNKALTPMEVASLYNETTPIEEPMHSLVDPFKDGSGKALYRLDGNKNDESGNYGSLFTGATTYVNGRFGRAGVIAGAATGSTGIPFPASAGSCTMAWWGNNSGTRGAAFGFYQDASHYVGVYAGTANTILAGGTTPKAAGTIPYDATTRHYAIVFNAGTAKVYVNGVLTGTTVTMDAGFTTINSFTDGGSTTTMYAEQVRIFNRALTASEVQTLYTEV